MGDGQVEVVELSVGEPPRRLFVVDNFVEPEAAEAIFAAVEGLPYTFNDSDRKETEEFRHFKHDFPIGAADGDSLMLMLADRARGLMGSLGIACGRINRIYANLNLFGDYQFDHHDGDGWTALLFANPEWPSHWGGEFIAYSGYALPYDYAISPKPGRLLIFDGLLWHRGGVPSKHCHLPRISIAIKFAR